MYSKSEVLPWRNFKEAARHEYEMFGGEVWAGFRSLRLNEST